MSKNWFPDACHSLAIEFMKHRWYEKQPEQYFWTDDVPYLHAPEYDFGENGEYFVGDDFGTFSDGSDYYHWSLSDMYTILSQGIPYDIATEHMDWSIENTEKPEWWVKLEYYAMKRKCHPEEEAKDFWRMLTREYHYDRACRLEDSYVAETERQMREIKEKFINENFPNKI